MKAKQLKEGLADLAYKAESDHEVQMARAELYKIAKYAIKMHEMLKGVEEREGLEGWVQSKITKAADYMGSVYHHMDYEQKFDEVQEAKEMSDKQKKFFGKKKESVEEAAEVITAEKLPSKKQVLLMCGKGMKKSEICKKYPNCDQKKLKEMIEACMGEMKESAKNKKGSVNESVEVIKDPSKMSFVEMLKLVKESGGQQQIDPVDETLWNWAQRVATSKVEESNKAEIFAGMIYERNGGRFEMYDVMAEDTLTEASAATCGCGTDCDHCGGDHNMSEVGKTCSCCDNEIKKR